MTLIEIAGRTPTVHPTAWIAPGAVAIGSVVLEEEASLWYGVVARGDRDLIHVGAGSNVQDGTVMHTDPGLELRIGRDVTVGHSVMLHGCTIEDGALIGIGSRVLNGAVVGAGSIIGAGAVVTPGTVVPPRSMVLGVPGKVVRELDEQAAGQGAASAAMYRGFAREHAGAHIVG